MAKIKFKTKLEPVYHAHNDELAYELVKVPRIERRHCDMRAFRSHPKFGSYANSDLFANLLTRQLALAGIKSLMRVDQMPDCVTIDRSGFLAVVTINIA